MFQVSVKDEQLRLGRCNGLELFDIQLRSICGLNELFARHVAFEEEGGRGQTILGGRVDTMMLLRCCHDDASTNGASNREAYAYEYSKVHHNRHHMYVSSKRGIQSTATWSLAIGKHLSCPYIV